MKIGFIGLGNLGTPIAENLLEQHPQLLIYNRTATKAQPLIEKGAVLSSSVKELAASCDVVFSMVSDDAALNHITREESGIAANLKKGGIHISMSTILPVTATQLTALHLEHKNYYIAAPVMGRPEAARAKKLNYLLAGDTSVFAIVKNLLQDAGAAGIWEFGNDPSHASVAKICSNFLIISAIESMAEGIKVANKSGIDAQQWMNMMTQTIFAAPIYINYGNIIMKEAFQPAAFSLKLGLKDVNLINEQASSVGTEMPVGKVLQQRLQQCVVDGLGEYDWTAIAMALK